MSVPSEKTQKRGRLIMAANSIGNVRDIPARSLLAVQTADLVIFEEDRGARLILKSAGVHREYWRYSEHRQEETLDKLKETLAAGKTAVYMSDQGVPGVADPGSALLELAYHLNAVVQVVPGPSSVQSALSACPFLGGSYFYAGFLPRESDKRIAKLQELDRLHTTLVILDTPYRIHALIEDCVTAFGDRRQALLAVDISGTHENFLVSSLKNLKELAAHFEEKLNFVLIIQSA